MLCELQLQYGLLSFLWGFLPSSQKFIGNAWIAHRYYDDQLSEKYHRGTLIQFSKNNQMAHIISRHCIH